MPTSSRYKELTRRLSDLRHHMLPKTFSISGTYSGRQIDRARGYRLLAHAEIESFIEDITLSAAKRKIADWKNSKHPSDLLICFLAHYHGGWDIDDDSIQPQFTINTRPKIKDAVEEAVQIAFLQYLKIHEKNHGVLEKNLKRLVLPIGVRKSELDSTWITDLEQFGKRRGETAHNTIKVQQQIDPQTELSEINKLLPGLEKLDQLVLKIAP